MDCKVVFNYREECLHRPFWKCPDVCGNWQDLHAPWWPLSPDKYSAFSRVPGSLGQEVSRSSCPTAPVLTCLPSHCTSVCMSLVSSISLPPRAAYSSPGQTDCHYDKLDLWLLACAPIASGAIRVSLTSLPGDRPLTVC